jgi:hypothetical protein
MKKSVFASSLLATTLILLASPGMTQPPSSAVSGLENAETESGFRFRVDDLRAVQKAIEAQERHTDALMKNKGIHGTAVSWAEDGSPVVKVFADISASAAGIPQSVDGIPVVVVHTGQVFALNVSCEARGNKNCDAIEASPLAGTEPASPKDWHERPVPIGISTGHVDITAGTLGCRVTQGCHTYALSNAHVFANENSGVVGDNILQPGPTDGGISPDDVIATLAESVPIVMGTNSSVKNRVDAAIALTDESMVGMSTRSDGYGTPKSQTVDPEMGMNVVKYGRSTLQKRGFIDSINLTVDVAYNEGSARFIGQIVIKKEPTPNFSRPGDSGSLILVDGGTDHLKPVGLLFASTSDNVYTIANPINEVLTALDITIDGD